jgi:hypothetical protein
MVDHTCKVLIFRHYTLVLRLVVQLMVHECQRSLSMLVFQLAKSPAIVAKMQWTNCLAASTKRRALTTSKAPHSHDYVHVP